MQHRNKLREEVKRLRGEIQIGYLNYRSIFVKGRRGQGQLCSLKP